MGTTIQTQGISRRSFLGGMAGAGALAALGLAGCAPSSQASGEANGTTANPSGAAAQNSTDLGANWLGQAPEIAEGDIAETRETDLLKCYPRTLHIAPEVCIMRHLKPHFAGHPGQYVTADLESPLADLHFDVQQIPLADDSVDVILCNHLLEHVADDRKALCELYRILKPGGWGILLSPVEADYEQTFEDDTITDPDERTRIFGQYDHRRIYGADYTDRLRAAGFEAADIDYAASFTDAERKLYALPADHIYAVYKH